MPRWAIVYIVVIALLVGGVYAVDFLRADPALVSQSTWHREGTSSAEGTFHPLPWPRRVVVARDPDPLRGHIARHLQQREAGTLSEATGRFDAAQGRIVVLSEEARTEAGLPQAFHFVLRPAIRHEYGHALLYDWLAAEVGEDDAVTLYGWSSTPRPPAWVFPAAIRPVVDEYREIPHGVYGLDYYTSTMSEYLAESYARVLAGEHVPPATKRFLLTLMSR